MSIKTDFGANVRLYRKGKGFSQEELSEKIEIEPNHLSRIERGRSFVSAELLERLVRALDVPVQALFASITDGAAAEDAASGAARLYQQFSDETAAHFEHIIEHELRRASKTISRRLRESGGLLAEDKARGHWR